MSNDSAPLTNGETPHSKSLSVSYELCIPHNTVSAPTLQRLSQGGSIRSFMRGLSGQSALDHLHCASLSRCMQARRHSPAQSFTPRPRTELDTMLTPQSASQDIPCVQRHSRGLQEHQHRRQYTQPCIQHVQPLRRPLPPLPAAPIQRRAPIPDPRRRAR